MNRPGRPTIKDVADAAGVSTAAVSYVLNGKNEVGDAVRKRVMAAAAALNYRPRQSAVSMRTGRSRTIGLVLPDLSNPFFPTLAQAIEATVRSAGYAVLLVDSAQGVAEHEGFELLERYGVDGICWCPATRRNVAAVRQVATPIVVVDRPMNGYDVVMSDERAGAHLIVEMLLSRGAESVGLITGPRQIAGTAERRRAFLDALKGRLELHWDVRTPLTLELSRQVVQRVARDRVDAIVCGSDVIAISVIRACQAIGRHIPDDVLVTGYDDIVWADLISPSLTTVRQAIANLGIYTARRLIERMNGLEDDIRLIRLPVELICRESCPPR